MLTSYQLDQMVSVSHQDYISQYSQEVMWIQIKIMPDKFLPFRNASGAPEINDLDVYTKISYQSHKLPNT